jgi:hypothetical protein
MKLHLGLVLLLSLFCLSFLVTDVFAEPFNVTGVPSQVGIQLGVGSFVGGLVCSIVILLLFLVPTMIMTKGKYEALYIILSLAILTPLVAMGWFNFWVFLVIVLAIAAGVAPKVADFLGGSKKR